MTVLLANPTPLALGFLGPADMQQCIPCESGMQASKQLPEGGRSTCSCCWCCFYLQSQAWWSCAYA